MLLAKARTHVATVISSEDLDQEKERISKLGRQARIEALEKLILDMEKESTVTSTSEALPSGSPPEQDLAGKQNGAIIPAEEESTTADTPVQHITNGHSLLDSPGPGRTEEQKGKAARLELYKALLVSAKAESPEPATASSPSKLLDDLAIDGAENRSPARIETDAVSASLDTSTSALAEPENPALKTGDVNGVVSTPIMNGIAPDVAQAATATTAASPPSTLPQQEGVKEQDIEKEEPPIVVKAEPVEMDFSALTAENSAAMPDQSAGDATASSSGDAMTHSHDHQQHLQPAAVSMEEDPLLAELFPTFPTSDSPMHANQMQTQEEADPLLAGMLQEVRVSSYFAV
jgi:hypothetical protein